jgi:hypothetical protein
VPICTKTALGVYIWELYICHIHISMEFVGVLAYFGRAMSE